MLKKIIELKKQIREIEATEEYGDKYWELLEELEAVKLEYNYKMAQRDDTTSEFYKGIHKAASNK